MGEIGIKLSKTIRKRIAEEGILGHPIEEIAKKYDTTTATVHRWTARLKIAGPGCNFNQKRTYKKPSTYEELHSKVVPPRQKVHSPVHQVINLETREEQANKTPFLVTLESKRTQIRALCQDTVRISQTMESLINQIERLRNKI